MTRSKKLGPFIFVLGLIGIIIFITGVQYGKHVQTADEAIRIASEFIEAQRAQEKNTPETNSLSFVEVSLSGCGVEMILPSSFVLQEESSQSATIADDLEDVVAVISCQTSGAQATPVPSGAQKTITNGVSYTTWTMPDKENWQQGTLKHPKRAGTIDIKAHERVLPYLQRVMQFTEE